MENEKTLLRAVGRTGSTFKMTEPASGDSYGRGDGIASVMGVMDRGGHCIAPGAFDACLQPFLKAGVVTLGHDYQGLPIGDPDRAESVGRNLSVGWEYHDTQTAQEARKVAKRRIAKGMDVGLSVGFSTNWDLRMWFDDGKAMWAFLEKMQPGSLSLYDRAGIEDYDDPCRLIMGAEELFEFAQCSVPMNALAVMTEAKTALGGPPAGLPLSEHLNTTLAVVKGAVDRLASYKAMKDKNDRPMSADRLAEAKTLRQSLDDLIIGAEQRIQKSESPEDAAVFDALIRQRLSLVSMTNT